MNLYFISLQKNVQHFKRKGKQFPLLFLTILIIKKIKM